MPTPATPPPLPRRNENAFGCRCVRTAHADPATDPGPPRDRGAGCFSVAHSRAARGMRERTHGAAASAARTHRPHVSAARRRRADRIDAGALPARGDVGLAVPLHGSDIAWRDGR